MQISQLLQFLSLTAAASAVTVAYDTGYDNAGRSLDAVACSDGPNGLKTRFGWQTQGQIPRFPNIGAAAAVGGWNSPNCGTCWRLSYGGRSVNVLAVDHAGAGFNIGLSAMNRLTGGQAVQLGRVEASATQVAARECGL
ncbi:hypothetical protein DL771_000939 [Monosporascus sp. 5C6A]|nr:hypothetical protein DL771_000939 [Monosporascus sp. 5C6A]